MNICIPALEDRGLGSPVCAHFGSAPLFILVDTDDETCRAFPNQNLHHGHGMCQPLLSLKGEKVDAMVVGGIGANALNRLAAANLRVFRSEYPTVAETLDAFRAGKLQPVTPATACNQHGTDRGNQGPHRHGKSLNEPGHDCGR